MAWPPQILTIPPRSVLAGAAQWKRRGATYVTVFVKQLFRVTGEGAPQSVLPAADDALNGDDRVPFKPRADVLVTFGERPASLEAWRGSELLMRCRPSVEAGMGRSAPPSRQSPAATVIEVPEGVDPRVYQIAPEEQQLESIVAGDVLVAHGPRSRSLVVPAFEVSALLRLRQAEPVPVALNVDAIEWDLDSGRFAFIARGQLAWSDRADAIVVLATGGAGARVPPSQTATIDADRPGAAVDVPFKPRASAAPPPPSLPVRPAGDPGTGTAVLGGDVVAQARAGALAAIAREAEAARRSSVDLGGTAALTPEQVAEARAQALAAVPFAGRDAVAPNPAPSAPSAPRIDTGTIASSEELERLRDAVARAVASERTPAVPAFPRAPLPAPPPPLAPTPKPAVRSEEEDDELGEAFLRGLGGGRPTG